MLDAVLELRAAGHDVQLYTAHHDERRCFAETLQGAPRRRWPPAARHLRHLTPHTRAGGKRAPWVHVHGGWLPRAVFGRLHALLAYARCLLVALAVLCAARDFHVVVLDQVSAPIPLLRAASRAKVRDALSPRARERVQRRCLWRTA